MLLLGVSVVTWLIGTSADWPEPFVDVVATVLGAALVLGYVRRDREWIAPSLAHTGITPANWWKPPAWFAVMGLFMFAYFGLIEWLVDDTARYLEAFEEAGWPMWTAFVLISVCPGVFEELAFRGVIQGRLERVLGTRDALVLQAAMFSVLHLNPLVFASHFAMGLMFGHLRRSTQSLYPGMLLHMAWNATILLQEI